VRLSLNNTELRRVRDLLRHLGSPAEPGALPPPATAALMDLLPCDDISRIAINPRAGTVRDAAVYRTVDTPNPGEDPELDELFWAAYRTETVCSYPYRSQSVDQVLSATDFMSQRQLDKSLTGALFRIQEVRANVVVPLWLDGGVEHRLELFRTDRTPFNERDKLLLTLLRPHLALHLRRAQAARNTRHPQLTERQAQLLALLADGLTNRQIAAQLSLAEGTVRRHLDNIYTRLGVTNRTAAVATLVAHQPDRS
jgi:Response regulator containing a CheY-like receiver domain and an HTH DNA-binding domain